MKVHLLENCWKLSPRLSNILTSILSKYFLVGFHHIGSCCVKSYGIKNNTGRFYFCGYSSSCHTLLFCFVIFHYSQAYIRELVFCSTVNV